MEWFIGIACYIGLVWMFLKLFKFIHCCDEEIDEMEKQKKTEDGL